MSKYLFYAAFLYFCWYAGNKAFPPAPQLPHLISPSESNRAGTGNKYSATAQNINVETHPRFNDQLEKNDVQARAGISKEQLLLHINTNISSRYNLIISPVNRLMGQVNFKQDNIISKYEMQPLTVLNKENK